MKTKTIMAAIIAAIIIVVGGGFAIASYLENRPVVFNDPALEQAVRTNIGISDRPITHKEAKQYVALDLALMQGYTKEIRDLTGLSAFSNLTKLNLENNMVTDTNELSKLKKLQFRDLSGNQISDVSYLIFAEVETFHFLHSRKAADI